MLHVLKTCSRNVLTYLKLNKKCVNTCLVVICKLDQLALFLITVSLLIECSSQEPVKISNKRQIKYAKTEDYDS